MVTLRQHMYVPPRWRRGVEQDEKTYNVGRNNKGDLRLDFTLEVIKSSQGKEELGKIIGKKCSQLLPGYIIGIYFPSEV